MRLVDSDITKLFNACLVRGEQLAKNPRKQAKLNEEMVNGTNMFSAMRTINGSQQYVPDAWDDDVPRNEINIIRNLVNTWAALINQDRVSATAYPAGPDPLDAYSADVGNTLIKWAIEKEKTAEKIVQMVQQCCEAGTAGIRIDFDETVDRVTWSNVSIHDFYIENTAEPANAKWVIFEKWLDIEDVQDIVESHDKEIPIAEENYKLPNGDRSYGVKVHEFYHRPNKLFPQGVYALIIGPAVVHSMTYPYITQDDSGKTQYLLPLVLMRARTIRGCVYGATNLTGCTGTQRSVIELWNREIKWLRDTAGVKLVAPADISAKWVSGANQTFGYNSSDPNAGKTITVLQIPEPPAAYSRLRAEAISMLPQLLGLNEATAGTENRTYSGVALETIYNLDKQRNQDAQHSLENAVLDAFKLYFALIARYYTVPRQIRITKGDRTDVVSFDAADIIGVDLRLQPGSELDKLSQVEEAQADAKLKDGSGTQLDVQKAYNTPAYGNSRRISRQLIADYLAGKTLPDPKPGIDFDKQVFDEELAKAKTIAVSSGNKADWLSLHSLAKIVDDEAASLADGPPAPETPTGPGVAPVGTGVITPVITPQSSPTPTLDGQTQ